MSFGKLAKQRRSPALQINPEAAQAVSTKLFGNKGQTSKPKSGAGGADLAGLGGLFTKKPRPRTCMPCEGSRSTMLRRPSLPLRIVNKNIEVAAGEGIFEQIVTDAGWGDATGLAKDSKRVFLSRITDNNGNYALVENRYVRWVRPRLMVYVSRPGVAIDHELSKQVAHMCGSNFGLVIDEDGQGKQLSLAPTLFNEGLAGGLALDDDQVFQFGTNSTIYFDYKGEGDLSNYTAADIETGSPLTITVEVGCDIILTDTPDEDIDDLIEQMEMIA